MQWLAIIGLSVAGIIHILPVTGILGADQLTSLYGMKFGDPNLVILMRHRAVLFGILGVFLLFAAFKPDFQLLAVIVGLVSVVSFLLLAGIGGGYSEAIGRVVKADLIALAGLISAGVSVWLR